MKPALPAQIKVPFVCRREGAIDKQRCALFARFRKRARIGCFEFGSEKAKEKSFGENRTRGRPRKGSVRHRK